MKTNATYGPASEATTLNGDIYVNSEATLRNLIVNGTIYINPGSGKEVILDTVTATNTVIQSGGTNSIYLKDVKTNNLTINDRNNEVRVELQGATEITNTKVQSGAKLEVTAGSFGSVELAPMTANPIALKGNFGESAIRVTKPNANLQVETGATVKKVTVEAKASGSNVTNNGTVVDLESKAESTAVDGAGTINKVTGDKAPEISEEVKVDKNESTANEIVVSNETQLKSALNNEKIKNIEFKNDIKATSQILVKQADQSINGKGFKLIAKNGMTYTEPNKSVLTVLAANGVSLSNLTVDAININNDGWDGIYTVQVYNSTGVKLNDVTLQNGDGGLLVNGSTVTVENIKTSKNEFGGIEVSNGADLKNQASTLTVAGKSTHDEDVHIWTVGNKARVVDNAQYKFGADIRDKKNGYVNFILKSENREVPYTVEARFTNAKDYVYPVGKDYEYVGISEMTGNPTDGYVVATSYKSANELLETNALHDMARFLGALVYSNGENAPTTINYNETDYTWNKKGTLKGSNWENKNNETLVSIIEKAFTAMITNESGELDSSKFESALTKLSTGLEFTVDGVKLTLIANVK